MKKELLNKVLNQNINSIKECYDGSLEGYSIFLENGSRIDFGISNFQSCCEDWGTIDSPDNISDYNGAKLLEVNCIGATSFNVTDDLDNVAFISVMTSKGLFQMAAYNNHNGYYGHSVKIIIDGETIEDDVI